MNFENQHVVITGGLGDIGKAICLVFARSGASVSLCDILPPEDAAPFLDALGEVCQGRCTYQQVDVSEPNQVKQWLDTVSSALGAPSIVIANAARVTLAPCLEITPEQWDHEVNVNLNGSFYVVQDAARRMVDQQIQGRVVFIGSWAAHKVHANMPAYSVTKSALRMLCKCMALELAPMGIMVNEVAPGYVQAGLTGKIWQDQPELGSQAAAQVPIGKFITPEAVAAEVIYLCRSENQHVTGATLLMDGGLSLT